MLSPADPFPAAFSDPQLVDYWGRGPGVLVDRLLTGVSSQRRAALDWLLWSLLQPSCFFDLLNALESVVFEQYRFQINIPEASYRKHRDQLDSVDLTIADVLSRDSEPPSGVDDGTSPQVSRSVAYAHCPISPLVFSKADVEKYDLSVLAGDPPPVKTFYFSWKPNSSRAYTVLCGDLDAPVIRSVLESLSLRYEQVTRVVPADHHTRLVNVLFMGCMGLSRRALAPEVFPIAAVSLSVAAIAEAGDVTANRSSDRAQDFELPPAGLGHRAFAQAVLDGVTEADVDLLAELFRAMRARDPFGDFNEILSDRVYAEFSFLFSVPVADYEADRARYDEADLLPEHVREFDQDSWAPLRLLPGDRHRRSLHLFWGLFTREELVALSARGSLPFVGCCSLSPGRRVHPLWVGNCMWSLRSISSKRQPWFIPRAVGVTRCVFTRQRQLLAAHPRVRGGGQSFITAPSFVSG